MGVLGNSESYKCKMLCSLRMLGLVCRKQKNVYVLINTGFVRTVGWVCFCHLAFSVVLMLPELVVVDGASIVGNQLSNDIFTSPVFHSSQTELRRGFGAVFVV